MTGVQTCALPICLNREGMAVVMVTHDIQNALAEADFVLHMGDGEYFYGTAEEYKKLRQSP